MTTDTRKLTAVFRAEYEATRDIDRAVAAVATAVKAQLELPLEAPPPVVHLHVTVEQRQPPASAPRRPSCGVEHVVTAAAAYYSLRRRDIIGGAGGGGRRGRHDARSMARWVAAEILRDDLGLSYPACGRALGVDHSTVINGHRQFATRPDLLAAVASIRRALAEEAAPTATSEAA